MTTSCLGMNRQTNASTSTMGVGAISILGGMSNEKVPNRTTAIAISRCSEGGKFKASEASEHRLTQDGQGVKRAVQEPKDQVARRCLPSAQALPSRLRS